MELRRPLLAVMILILLFGCGTKEKEQKQETSKTASTNTNPVQADFEYDTLPDGLKWVTNTTDPVWSSPKAKKGGTYRSFLLSFPLTLRYVGPDSNGSFRRVINQNRLGLTEIHPNTDNIIPALATHWAYDDDGKTVYYKLDQRARWSDGQPVTAHDFAFTIEFMRSKHIVAPWYNTYYSEQIDKVRVFDDHTLAVVGAFPKPRKELHYYYGLTPIPRHFHKLDEDWVKNTNWKIEPNTGPYIIDKIEKGKRIILKRKKDWWAKDDIYNKNRYNVDKIIYTVIRDLNVAYVHFSKNELDAFSLTLPDYWHNKAKGVIYDKGYVHKLWFYTDQPQPDMGMWLNQDIDIFKDKNVRYAFAHAMNIDKLIETVLRGDYMRLHNGTTGYGAYDNKSIKARPFDLNKVDTYLQKAGWDKRGPDGIRIKGGKRFSVRITYGQKPHTDRLVFLKQEALKAGIELQLQLLDGNAAFKTMLEKKHEVAWSGWGAMWRPQYWGQYHSENAHKPQTNNFSNTDNKELDALIDQFRNATEEEPKIKLAHQIQQFIYDEGAYIPTFMVPYFRLAYWRYWRFPEVMATKQSDSVFDLYGSTGGLFWLDPELKEETKAARKKGTSFKPVTLINETYKPGK